MSARGYDAVVIMGSDPHGSESAPQRYRQVEWLTGFTGETADFVVTDSHAGLWTDTRYFIQAESQLKGSGAVLHKTRVPEQVLIPEWLRKEFGEDCVIAVDGLCTGVDFAEQLPGSVVSVPDILDIIWKDRPGIPQTAVFTVEPGESRASRISFIRDWLEERGSDGCLLSALDDIAWTLNVRASDIDYNPLVISYLLVTGEEVRFYVLKDDIEDPDTREAFAQLEADGVMLCRYDEALFTIQDALPDEATLEVDSSLNLHLYKVLEDAGVGLHRNGQSPVMLRKAVKNPTEIGGMRDCHIRDGVAMERFLHWLDKSIRADRRVSEWDAAVKLGQLRSEMEGYQGDSFETISAYGPGAALPHYVTPRENSPVLEPHGLYLCDAGAQYLDGTTDITRTVPLGECTELEQEDYTLVLKGHIDLSMAVFPEGTAGCQIDALAREPLWRALRNFGHGTGHGVGWFLCVHEGPQDIRQNLNGTPLLPGMITSNEPGIYREGLHGVRHENLVLCTEHCTNEFGKWLKFEPLTLCHFDTSVIDTGLLNADEIRWLNDYNARVYRTLSPLLPEDVAEWLRVRTAPIG